MRPLVHVQSAQPDHPAKAAHASSEWILSALASRRGLTMMVDAWAPLPGATVTPWVLRGIAAAMPEQLIERHVVGLGDPRVAQRVFDAAGLVAHAHASAAELRNASRLRLRIAGSARDAAVPRAWLGTNLAFVTPLSHRAAPSSSRSRAAAKRERAKEFYGPACASLAALARACGLEGNPTQLARFGATLVREVFASGTLIVDGTWWAPLDASGVPVGSAVAVEHCLASPSWGQADAAQVLDAWIGGLLGHPPRPDVGARVTPRIAGERKPWPRAVLPASRQKARGLATRAVEAVWSRATHNSSRRPVARAALAPPTPGRFARVWTAQMR